MRYLKKINKGLALTIIVLLVLVIYLVSVEAKRNKEKPRIEEACKSYIEIMDKYAVLPENGQKLYMTSSNEEREKIESEFEKILDSQMTELEKELKTKMIENETVVKMQKDTLKEYLEERNNPFGAVISSYNKEIIKIRKFSFDEDQVTVTFTSKVEQETKYLDETENKELTKKDSFDSPVETITLQNIDGTWKVVYADLWYSNPNSTGFGITTVMY